MKPLHRNILGISIAVGLTFLVSVWIVNSRTENGLSLAIVTDLSIDGHPVIDLDKSFKVAFRNNTESEIRILHPDSREGYFSLTLEATNLETGEVFSTRHRPVNDDQYYEGPRQGNNPGSDLIAIAPHESYQYPVKLTSITFGSQEDTEWIGIPDPNDDQKYSINARYQFQPGTANKNSSWTGRIKSEPVEAFVISDRFVTPHEAIEFGLAKLAIRVMKNAPDWIEKKDKHQRTPLHVAASFGRMEVVKWLLDNGADVNGSVQNGRTPLHITTDPETVKLILQYNPDLSIRFHDKTPLQSVVDDLFDARWKVDKDRLDSMVTMYLEAGAEYDILTAIHRNDLDRVKVLSNNSVEPVALNRFNSPLRRAASLGRFEICKYLITERGVNVNQFEEGNGDPIIKDALRHPEIVRLLIENGADLNKRIYRDRLVPYIGFVHYKVGNEATALHFAAKDGNPETIKLLIDGGVDLFAEARNWFTDQEIHQTALDVAAYYGKADNAEAIINHPAFDKADPVVRQKLLDKCLIVAARSQEDMHNPDRPKLFRVLLEKGADPLATNEDGNTALVYAACRIFPERDVQNEEQKRLVAILLEHGGVLDFVSAVAMGDEAAVTRMLQADPKLVNAIGPGDLPVLYDAVCMDYRNIVDLLLDGGAEVDSRDLSSGSDGDGITALNIAAFWGRVELAKRLIEAGADVNARDSRQRTPLHSAAARVNIPLMRLLLDNGADVDAKDSDGKTPFDLCEPKNPSERDDEEKYLEARRVLQEYQDKK